MRAWQINLQPHLGGGEIYAAFLSRALARHGVPTTLAVNARARFWETLDLAPDTELIRIDRAEDLLPRLPRERSWLLGHGPLPTCLLTEARHFRTAIAHMPPQGRDPRAYDRHDLVLPVSAWVLEGLRALHAPAWQEPLYGVAEARGTAADELRAGPVYDFDRRKLRDRVLSWMYPAALALRRAEIYRRHEGVTLGIVSRLTPIKQFPALFDVLAPQMAKRPGVYLEIFGAGGYGSVRDLKSALRPLAGRVRFWGYQRNVAAVYANLDWLLTGLPEKEALGLNVVEAQLCGLPVLAVAAPPFTETMVEDETGHLFVDPRQDGGAGFGRLLDSLLASPQRPDPRLAQAHLARFTFDAFASRVGRVLGVVRENVLGPRSGNG
jgi:glycosyltransferase involved in cell wall biosynthesis